MIHMTTGYSLETYGAKVALEKSLPLVQAALQQLPNEPLQLIDYGIADGGTALDFFHQVITSIRDRNQEPLTFIGNDLPSNPHNDLALNLEELRRQHAKLRVFIAPTSFYEQLTSDHSTHFGFSATALHWLSRIPGPLDSHIHANSAEATERDRFREQALDDFEHLMRKRARELKPGGQLVLINLAEADDGQSLGRNHQDQAMFDYLRDVFGETIKELEPSEAILRDTIFQNYYKRKADFEEVLQRSSLRDQFRIKSHHIEHTPCPYRATFDEHQQTDAFAEGLMKTIRSWSRHTFLSALGKYDQDPAIADQFYTNLQERFRQNPAAYSMDYIHSFLHLERI